MEREQGRSAGEIAVRRKIYLLRTLQVLARPQCGGRRSNAQKFLFHAFLKVQRQKYHTAGKNSVCSFAVNAGVAALKQSRAFA